MNIRKPIFFSIIGLVAIIGAIFLLMVYKSVKQARYTKETVPQAIELSQMLQGQQVAMQNLVTNGNTQETVPKELNIKMAFFPQAPFADWGSPWQDACEEASILLVANAYDHHNWTRENFRDQILNLVDWENENFGDYKNTNAQQIAQMLQNYLNLHSVIHRNPTFEDVQQVLARGHLIIMTFAGKEIGNPFYKNGGPDYHAMVIKGYKEGRKIITEDVGTQHGEDYVYPWQTLQNALHEYAQPIDNGAKVMIEVLPPDNN